jgi:integrase
MRSAAIACTATPGTTFPHNSVPSSNGIGRVENIQNILNRGFFPAQVAAGVVTKNGGPKYTGLHALRHFFASWCINRRQDSGPELPLKVVQERLGHSTVVRHNRLLSCVGTLVRPTGASI